MHKIWEFLALIVVLSIVIGVVSATVEPYLPIIGIIIAAMIVLTVAVVLVRLAFLRRKFW